MYGISEEDLVAQNSYEINTNHIDLMFDEKEYVFKNQVQCSFSVWHSFQFLFLGINLFSENEKNGEVNWIYFHCV